MDLSEKWVKCRVPGNAGQLDAWRVQDYVICQNVNRGSEGWWFELLRVVKDREIYVAEARTLDQAKLVGGLDLYRRELWRQHVHGR